MSTDDRWIARNFDKLMEEYGGRFVAVVNRKVVAVGDRPDRVESSARKATGARTPSVVRVPAKGRLEFAPLRLFGLS